MYKNVLLQFLNFIHLKLIGLVHFITFHHQDNYRHYDPTIKL